MVARMADRKTDLARIHCLKRDLHMDDDGYRDMLFAVARVRSAGDLGIAGRAQVIAHLSNLAHRTLGDRSITVSSNGWAWVNAATPERRPLLRKLAMMLKESGRGRPYLDGVATKMYGIEKIEFCAPDQLRSIVAALVIDQKRRAPKVSEQTQ